MTTYKFNEERKYEITDYYPNAEDIIKQIKEAINKVNKGEPKHKNDCFRYWHDRGFIEVDVIKSKVKYKFDERRRRGLEEYGESECFENTEELIKNIKDVAAKVNSGEINLKDYDEDKDELGFYYYLDAGWIIIDED